MIKSKAVEKLEMKLHPSKIPTGTVLPAKHHFTKFPNRVKVGRVTIGKIPGDTIKQPIYLRQGYGIFLRKYLNPRRDHYGKQKVSPRLDYKISEYEDEYSGTLAKALYTPGLIMSTNPIAPHQLDPQFLKLQTSLPTIPSKGKAIQAQLETRPDIQRIVQPDLESRRMLGPLIMSPCFSYFDQEDRKPPPPFFIPPSPLPGPVFIHDSPSEVFYFTKEKLLRRPDVPKLRVPLRGPSVTFASSSQIRLEERSRERFREKHPLPEFVPRVLPSASASAMPHVDHGVQVTSERVQENLVDLGDLFPYRADQGLLAEIDFYMQEKNFPLLLTRNAHVNLENFNALNPLRMLPPEHVLRVDALSKKTAHQTTLTKEVKREDSDAEDTFLEDNVFNPIYYSFNEELYRSVDKASKAKQL